MERNIRNELVVAIFTLCGIILSIGAIFILSLSTPADELTMTPSQIAINHIEQETPMITSMAQAASLTEAPIISPTSTLPTSTLSSLQNSALATLTALASSPTNVIPSVITNTATPTHTAPIPSNTPIPVTNTQRASNTPIIPIYIPTMRPSNTPMIPTYTPTLPPTNIATPSPIVTQTILSPDGCLDPSIQIISPQPNQRMSTVFDVIGTATLLNFGLYRIEIRADSAFTYERVNAQQQVIFADKMAQIDPTQYPPGIYWIRLVVIDNRGNIAPNGICAIPTIFE